MRMRQDKITDIEKIVSLVHPLATLYEDKKTLDFLLFLLTHLEKSEYLNHYQVHDLLVVAEKYHVKTPAFLEFFDETINILNSHKDGGGSINFIWKRQC